MFHVEQKTGKLKMNPAIAKMMVSAIGLDTEQVSKLKNDVENWLENQNRLIEKINLVEKEINDIHNIMILIAEKKGLNYGDGNSDS